MPYHSSCQRQSRRDQQGRRETVTKIVLSISFSLVAAVASAQPICGNPYDADCAAKLAGQPSPPVTPITTTDCVGGLFQPYPGVAASALPCQEPTGTTTFMFTGVYVNPWSVTYLDVFNGSNVERTIRYALHISSTNMVTRSVVLQPGESATVQLHEDPTVKGGSLSFSVVVDTDAAGTASVTMRPRDNPWGSAVLPTPHITEH
jgi:hypothetical protein